MNYLEGNLVKYVTRYKFKNGLEDLLKARWYLDRLIEDYNEKGVKDETRE
jgi:glutamate mutase epsilon subunit